VLGISPRYIQTPLQAGYIPRKAHDLGSLRLVLTTGAPLSIEHHDFVKDRVGQNVFLFNGSGGTGSPTLRFSLIFVKWLILLPADVCNHHICTLSQCATRLDESHLSIIF